MQYSEFQSKPRQHINVWLYSLAICLLAVNIVIVILNIPHCTMTLMQFNSFVEHYFVRK